MDERERVQVQHHAQEIGRLSGRLEGVETRLTQNEERFERRLNDTYEMVDRRLTTIESDMKIVRSYVEQTKGSWRVAIAAIPLVGVILSGGWWLITKGGAFLKSVVGP